MNNTDLSVFEAYFGVKRFYENWGWYLALGILLVILGILTISGSYIATFSIIVFFGSLLLIGGILQIAYAFWGRKGQGFVQTLLSGIFYAIVGGLMVTHPTASAMAITLLLAGFYTITGIFKIVVSLATPVIQWKWLLFSGLVSLALGILIWAEWPISGMWFLGLLIGIDLIFLGWFWIMLSVSVKCLADANKP